MPPVSEMSDKVVLQGDDLETLVANNNRLLRKDYIALGQSTCKTERGNDYVNNLEMNVSRSHSEGDNIQQMNCLESSIELLQSSVETAKASCDATDASSSTWWATMINRLNLLHEADRKRWNEDLRVAKLKGGRYKQELKSTIEERIEWLEERLALQETLSRVSTGTTRSVSSDEGGESRNPASSGGKGKAGKHLAPNVNGIEVSYDSSMAVQRVTELERAMGDYEREKNQLASALEQAEKMSKDGASLSANMQGQMLDLMREIEKAETPTTTPSKRKSSRQKKDEKVAIQSQLLQLLEQQHATSYHEWKAEKDLLENTIAQLTADKMELRYELEAAQEHAGQYRKLGRRRSNGDSSSGMSPPGSPRGISPSRRGLSSTPPRSPSRVEWDDKLDRAMAERDAYKQEAETIKKNVEQLKERTKEEIKAKLQQLRHDAQHTLQTKETQWKLEMERQLKEQREEYSAIIAEMEEALDGTGDNKQSRHVEKRQQLVTKIKQLERQHDEERGEWKLQLEGALQEARKDKQRADQLEKEYTKNLDRLEERLRAEMDLLREKHEKDKEKWAAQIRDMKSNHSSAIEQMEVMIDAAKMVEREKTEKLVEDFEKQRIELTTQVDDARYQWQSWEKQADEFRGKLEAERKNLNRMKEKYESQLRSVIADKDSQIMQLQVRQSLAEENEFLADSAAAILQGEKSSKDKSSKVFAALEELHKDVVSVRESIENSKDADAAIENANYVELSENILAMQETLGDALAELTLGTEAIFDLKQQLLIDRNASGVGAMNSLDGVMPEIIALRADISSFREKNEDGLNVLEAASRQEFLGEIQRREVDLASVKGELEQVKVQLENQTSKLHRAESELETLNDQVNAYSEELMLLQSRNSQLEDQVTAYEIQRKQDEGDDSPLLDEALALAEGLTSLVHGGQDNGNVMDLLQSMSDLMERHENGEQHALVASSRKTSSEAQSTSLVEMPPSPVRTPMQSRRHSQNPLDEISASSLQVVVEQLYSRCQLLERERTQMMEVTLDLLTSAREANEAELDAALATARRKSMEEVSRIRQQTHVNKERLYQKLCGNCVQDISQTGS